MIEAWLPQKAQVGFLQNFTGVLPGRDQTGQIAVQGKAVPLEQLAREVALGTRKRLA
jgi:hypothetical protein